MYDDTASTQLVKFVAKHSSAIPRWRAIAELYMRVGNESLLADFVVCVFWQMKSASITNSWFITGIPRAPVMFAIFVVKVSIKQTMYKSTLHHITRMIHESVRKRRKTKVKCVQFAVFGWVADIVWNCIANAIQWNQIVVPNAVWKRPITMLCWGTFEHSTRFDESTNAVYVMSHSIVPMSFK